MSEINENIKEIDTQINNLKESIKQKKNDIEQLLGQQTTLTDTPQKAIIQNRILQKQNQIKQNKQQLKTLKQIKQNLDKSQQIISKNNQQEEQGQIYDGDKIPTPNDEYIPKPTPVQEQEQEEQGEIYDGNKIPTPDDEYIPKPTPEQEDKEDKEEEDKDEQDENEVINKAQINGPREIEMSKLRNNINLGNPIMTRKYRGTLPQGRLNTLKQVTRRKSISNAGFSETIIQKLNRPTGPMTINMKICPTILDTGKKVNNKYFIPSQFPNLTKPKQLVQNISKKSNKINIKQKKKTLKKIKKLNKTKNK